MADTRKDKRAPVSLKVRFKSATVDEFIEHYSRDVSSGGIFIKSSKPLAVGTLMKFQFQLKDESALIRGVGRVVWVRATDAAEAEQPAGMGVKFIKLDDSSRAIVDRIADIADDGPGEFEAGRASATVVERPSVPVSDSFPSFDSLAPPDERFFQSTIPPGQPLPDERTEVRHSAEFLAAALREGATDQSSAREAEVRADQARARSQELADQRRAESDAAQRVAREELDPSLPSMIVDANTALPDLEDALTLRPVKPASVPPAAVTQPAGRSSAPPAPRTSTPPPALRPSDPVFDSAGPSGADRSIDTGKLASGIPRGRSPLVPVLVLAVVVGVAAFVAMRGRPEEDPARTAVPAAGEAGVAPSGDAEPAIAPTAVAEPSQAVDAALAEAPDAAAPDAAAPDAAPDAEEPALVPVDADAATPELVDAGADAAVDDSFMMQIRTSPRSSRISVNGKQLPGREPLLSLRAGESITIVATSPGRFPETRQVVAERPNKIVRFALLAKPYVVHVVTDPPGARIAAGTKRGDSPGDIDLADTVHGTLRVQARLPGYQLGKVMLPMSAFVERDHAMLAEVNFKLVPRPADAGPEALEDADDLPIEPTPDAAPAPVAPEAPEAVAP